jgi:hypothetical protein
MVYTCFIGREILPDPSPRNGCQPLCISEFSESSPEDLELRAPPQRVTLPTTKLKSCERDGAKRKRNPF